MKKKTILELDRMSAEQFHAAPKLPLTVVLDNVRSLKGFAQLLNGDREQAVKWIENILATVTDKDGFVHYMGACFYTVAGDNERAIALAHKAMELGYANYYEWMTLNDGLCTVALLRDDLSFLRLIEKYKYLWD